MSRFDRQTLRKSLPLLVCLLLSLAAGLWFSSQKQGLFIDEIYSYGLSNSEYAPFIKDLKGGDVVDQIYTRQDLMDYVAVQDGESFGFFQSVYYNQEQDVHPPLYYFLLHLISVLTPNAMNQWTGLLLNFLFFLGTMLLIWAIGRRIFERPASTVAAVLCYGLSSLAMSALTTIRMYMLLSFFSILLAYFLIRLDEAEEKGLSAKKRFGFLILFALTITAGLLTQYYFIFYAFFLCLFYLIRTLLKKKWGLALRFSLAAFGGVGLMVLIFPAVIRHLTSGALVSGDNAVGNLFNFSRWPEQLKYYLIGSEVRLWAGVRLALLGLIVCLIFGKRFLARKKEGGVNFTGLWLAAPAALAMVLIAIVSPVQTLRYIWSLAPALSLGAAWLLDQALLVLPEKKLSSRVSLLLQLAAFGLIVLLSAYKARQFPPEYLYPEMPAMNEAVKEQTDSGAACLYLTDHYYSPLTQDLVQLAYFEEFYVTDRPDSEGAKAYLAAKGDPERLVVFVDTDEFWSSGYKAEELLNAYMAESAYTKAERLYSFGLSETWLLTRSPAAALPEPDPSALSFTGQALETYGGVLVVTKYPGASSFLSKATETDWLRVEVFSGLPEAKVLTGADASFALQKELGRVWTTVHDSLGEDASVELKLGTSVTMPTDIGSILKENGDGHYRLIKRVSVDGAIHYYASDFYVLKNSDPANYMKSRYQVNPRNELELTVQYPSQKMLEQNDPAQLTPSVDITLSLLWDSGIDPITGNGNDFILEEEIGGVWYTVPRASYYNTLEGYMPMVGNPVQQTIGLSEVLQHPGHYRILKDVIIGRGDSLKTEYYAAEFTVPAGN